MILLAITFGFGGLITLPLGLTGNSEALLYCLTCFALSLLCTLYSIALINGEKAKKRQEQSLLEKKQKEIAYLFGLEKYKVMLDEEVKKQQQAAISIRKLGSLLQQSVYQEKEADWAVWGGIAEGLAGPAAGVVTAVQVMQDNERIRAENVARRELAAQRSLQFNAIANNISPQYRGDTSIAELQRFLAVIVSASPLTLFRFIAIHGGLDIDADTGAVTVVAHWKQSDESIWIDGSIRAKLYNATGKCLGCAYLSFPIRGTSLHQGSLKGICVLPKKAAPTTVKFEPINLWELAPIKSPYSKVKEHISISERQRIVNKLESDYWKEVQGH